MPPMTQSATASTDNDCDGRVDEEVALTRQRCDGLIDETAGVCQGQVQVCDGAKRPDVNQPIPISMATKQMKLSATV